MNDENDKPSVDESLEHDSPAVESVYETSVDSDVTNIAREFSVDATSPIFTKRDADTSQTHERRSDSLEEETLVAGNHSSQEVSHFHLISRLGRGGFGSVYLADDTRLNRKVAVKISNRISSDQADSYYPQVLREARAAAQLSHPNIVQVFEVAEHEGRPFIVSAFIDGMTLAKRMREDRIPIREAAEMCKTIALAIAYANNMGLYHRDIKPGNILLDKDNQPHVTDFGLAKFDSVEETISGESAYLGTPAYMSPEQAAGLSHDVDARSDLYSLGVVLFELITGERPFRGSSQMVMKQVLQDEPPSPRKLNQTIPRDLETICLKCLQKVPDRRYQSCGELANELQRYLADEPIQARPISSIERAYRWCMRHRAISGFAAALLVSLVVGLSGVTWQWRQAEHSRGLEYLARMDADRANESLASQVRTTERMLYGSRLSQCEQALHRGRLQEINTLLEPFTSIESSIQRDFEYYYLRNLRAQMELLVNHIEPVTDVCVNEGETHFAAAGLRTVMVYRVEDGTLVRSFRGHTKRLTKITFVPGTDLLISASDDGYARVWSIKSGQQDGLTMGGGRPIKDFAIHPTNKSLVAAHAGGEVTIWDLESRKQTGKLESNSKNATAVCFLNNGTQFAIGGDDGKVSIWETESHELVTGMMIAGAITKLNASPDNQWLVACNSFAQFDLWTIGDWGKSRFRRTFGGLACDITCLGEDLAVVADNGGANYLCNLANGKLLYNTMTHNNQGTTFGSHAFLPLHQQLLVGSGDGTAKLVRFAPMAMCSSIEIHDSNVNSLHLLGQSNTSVSCSDGGQVVICDTDDARSCGSLAIEEYHPISCRPTRDGSTVYFGCNDGSVIRYDVAQKHVSKSAKVMSIAIVDVNLGPREDELILAGSDGTVCQFDLNEPNECYLVHHHGGAVQGIVTTANSQVAYTAGMDGCIYRFDFLSKVGSLVMTSVDPIYSLAIAPDEQTFAIGLGNGNIEIRDVETTELRQTLVGHVGPVQDLLFLPLGKTLASGGNDRLVKLWDVEYGEFKLNLEEHSRSVQCLAVSARSDLLLSGDSGGRIDIWRAPRETPRGTPQLSESVFGR